MEEFNDDDFDFDFEELEEFDEMDFGEFYEDECACETCDGSCEDDDPYKIQEKSEKIYADLEAKNLSEEDLIVEIQKDATRMILDIIDEACAVNDMIKGLTKQFRDEFFIDSPLNYNKLMEISKSLVQNLFIVRPHPSVAATAMMLPEAIERQKKYGIFEFK